MTKRRIDTMKNSIFVLAVLALCCVFALSGCEKIAIMPSVDNQQTVDDQKTTGSDGENINEQKKPSDGLEYTLNPDDGSYFVSGIGTCTDTDVVIPSSYEDKPVTSISHDAFVGCESLTSISIPDSVTNIGYNSFSWCRNLISITLSDSVTNIGDSAFYGCESLTGIAIPDSVTSIGEGAFFNCKSLKSITIPKNVTSIGDYSFSGCPELTSIEVDEGNVFYHSSGNCLIEIATKTLIAGCQNSVIPTDGSVTSIGRDAFSNCSSLTSITIPDSVTSIGLNAFFACTALTSITFSNSITNIGEGAFAYTAYIDDENNLEEGILYFGNILYRAQNDKLPKDCIIKSGTTIISDSAFNDCANIASITIPDSVISIGTTVFSGCNSLESITVDPANTVYHSSGNCLIQTETKTLIAGCKNSVIPTDGSVTSISEAAFFGNSGLASITIPDSVTSIGDDAFYLCTNLENITVEENNSKYCSIDGILYDKPITKIICIPKNLSGQVSMPNGVTIIDRYAFYCCSSLTSITIPNSVTSIGEDAFSGCSSLTSITIPDGLMSISRSAFEGCSSLASIILPDSVTNIEDCVFSDCIGLTSITLSSSLTSIGERAFYRCGNLTGLTLPENVKSIGKEAFCDCGYLMNIAFGGNISLWNAVDKGESWCTGTSVYTVHCTDGDIEIKN